MIEQGEGLAAGLDAEGRTTFPPFSPSGSSATLSSANEDSRSIGNVKDSFRPILTAACSTWVGTSVRMTSMNDLPSSWLACRTSNRVGLDGSLRLK